MPNQTVDRRALIHSPAFVEMLPRLCAYAVRLLAHAGLVEGRDTKPSGDERDELLDETVVLFLAAEQAWEEGVSFEQHLGNVMRSRAGHVYRAQRRRRTREADIEDVQEPPAPPSDRDDAIVLRSMLDERKQVFEGDPETRALYETTLRTRGADADLEKALGWGNNKLRAVRERMNRRLAAQRYDEKKGDDDDGSPGDRPPRAAPAPRRGARPPDAR
jgi:DNA-directed RNA polymerase specialized sigma24 family protein